MRQATIIMAIFAGCLASAPSMAAPDAEGAGRIFARVPAVCDISADSFTLDQSGVVTGAVREFCNTSTGYQVLASYRPLDTGENATLKYGANTTTLDMSGTARVAFRTGQRLETVPVRIDATGLSRPLAVAFSLSAV